MADGFFRKGTENKTRLSSFDKSNPKIIYQRSQVNVTKWKQTDNLPKPKVRRTVQENSFKVQLPNCTVENFVPDQLNTQSKGGNCDSNVTERVTEPVSPGISERQLTRLASVLQDSLISDPPKQNKVLENGEAEKTEKKAKSRKFYVEKWPEAEVKLDNTIAPFTRTVTVTTRTLSSNSLLGGEPISCETAKDLRLCINGSAIHALSLEWKKIGLVFQNVTSQFSYGLVTTQGGGIRCVILAVQAHIIQQLLFVHKGDNHDLSSLRPSESRRRSALVHALSDMFWRAGMGLGCCVCLPQGHRGFPTQPGYRDDDITEMLVLFRFQSYEELESFIRRHLDYFTGEFGCLLGLYSQVLSRGVKRISDDQGVADSKVEPLLTQTEGCTFSLINLLVTGQAVKYLHNGLSVYDEFGQLMPNPLKGVEERCPVGLLLLDESETRENKTQVGSMLKTPKYPIWLTMVNGMLGLLFSLNQELISHWRAEHVFSLYYYTGLPSQTSQTCLSIDTRFNKHGRVKTAIARREMAEKAPALEKCILTKWYDADIKWNGTCPFY